MRSIAYHQSGTLCISSISKKLHIIKQTDFLCTPKGVMRYNSLCELMIYTLKRGDIPSLSAWIKKSRSVERDFLAPPVGLEPTTTRLTAECSTDWAKEECLSFSLECSHIISLCKRDVKTFFIFFWIFLSVNILCIHSFHSRRGCPICSTESVLFPVHPLRV